MKITILSPVAEHRVRWFIDFVRRDLDTLSDKQWGELTELLPQLAKVPWRFQPLAREAIVAAQAELGECLDGLVRQGDYSLGLPLGSRLAFVIAQAERQPKRRRPPKTWARARGQVIQSLDGPLSVCVVLEFMRLLDRIGAERLAACPLVVSERGEPCARVFIAVRRQRYCSVKHSREAAMRAFRERQSKRRGKRGPRQ